MARRVARQEQHGVGDVVERGDAAGGDARQHRALVEPPGAEIFETPSVSTWPGATALTRTPWPAHSTAIVRVRLLSAALVAE